MSSPLITLRRACALLALFVAAEVQAMPVVVIEDFESGLASHVGHVYLDGGAIGTGPLQGTQQAVLTTSSTNGAVPEDDVEDAFENGDWGEDVPNNLITRVWRRFLRNPGLSSNGNGPQEGSALQITFFAEDGDTLEFDYDFLTNDADQNPFVYTDFAWYYLDRPSGRNLGVLEHTNQAGFTTFTGPGYEEHTGSQTFSLSLSETGTYTITIGVNDVEDAFENSALVVDWFRLIKGPEPGTFGTVAAGLTALHGLARRRRRR